MAGNKEGAAKAHLTKLKKYGKDFYAKVGAQSWKNERSHEIGFALLSEKERQRLGAKGGSKTKSEYKEKTNTPAEAEKADSGVSE